MSSASADTAPVIDLHAHTTISDGSLSPRALVALAAQSGLRAVAVTDHDTVDGVPEALAAGRELGVEVVPGVEINIAHRGLPLDLLGYFLGHPPGEPLRIALGRMVRDRDARNVKILARLRELGVPVDARLVAAIAGDGPVGRPHIAEALRRQGHVDSIAEAFGRFLAHDAPAYVDRPRLSIAEAVALIHAEDGLAVVAHPGLVRTDRAGLVRLVDEARRDGVDGLECYYPGHDEAMVESLLGLARDHDLVATGGSDFHGDPKPDVLLGHADGGRPVPYSVLEAMRERLAARA